MSNLSSIAIPYQILVFGNKNEISRLMKQKKFDFNRRDKNGNTILHLILQNENLVENDVNVFVEIALDRGVDPNIYNNEELTALHFSVAKRWKNSVDLLLKRDVKIDVINSRGDTIADFFIKDESKKFEKFFELEDGSFRNSDSEMEQMEIQSASFFEWLSLKLKSKGINYEHTNRLCIGCMSHNLHHISLVLLKYIDNAFRLLCIWFMKNERFRAAHCYSELTKARYYAYTLRYGAKIVKLLLDKECSLDFLSRSIRFEEDIYFVKLCIDYCIEKSREPNSATTIFAKLFKYIDTWDQLSNDYILTVLPKFMINGANINVNIEDGKTPLYYSVKEVNRIAVDFLDDCSADFNVITDDKENIFHALAECCWCEDTKNEPELFELIMSKQCCDMNAKNKDDETPLHLASREGNLAIVQKLVEHGAKIDCRNKDGLTPLHQAAGNDVAEDVVEYLLQSGSEVNTKDRWNRFPLHLAANQNVKIVQALLKRGAYVNSYTAGKSPFYIAIDSYCIKNVTEMLMYGGDINDQGIVSLVGRLDPKHRSGKPLIEIILCHWIKLKAAKLPRSQKYEALVKDKEYQQFYEKCLEESKVLNNTVIDSHTSLYDFLQMDTIGRLLYIYNKKLESIVEHPEIKKQFPEYSPVILSIYRQTVGWKKLLEPAKQAWRQLIKVELPEECIELILGHLQVEDLASMIEHNPESASK